MEETRMEVDPVSVEAVAMPDTSESTPAGAGTEQSQLSGDVASSEDKKEEKETPTKTDEAGKKVYTEEERLKRKTYFKQLREKRRLARERFNSRNQPRSGNIRPPREDIVISFNMTEEDDKVLEFYRVKLTALKSTNEQLHKRLAALVRENFRLLQYPPLNKS